MAQKILLRRGGIDNIGSTIAVSKGELLFASGSINGVEHVVFVANADGNNSFTPVSKLYTGTAAANSFNAALNGLPYYKSDSQALFILNNAGSTALDLSGNLEGTQISSIIASGSFSGSFIGNGSGLTNLSLGSITAPGNDTEVLYNNGGAIAATSNLKVTATTLDAAALNIVTTGDISGSNLKLTGNADISGNVVIGGNITVCHATKDYINFEGEISSSIVPDGDNAFSLGTPTNRWKINGVDSTISGSFSGSFDGNFTGTVNGGSPISGTGTTDYLTKWTSGTTVGDSTIIDNGTNVRVTTNLVVTGSTDLLGNITLSGNSQTINHTGTGNLSIASSAGNVLIEGTTFSGNDVSIAGNLTVLGTQTQIDSTVVNIGDNIIVLNAAGAVADGGIVVQDTTGAQTASGSLLWNATDDYWYAGTSGSTQYRLVQFTSGTGVTLNYLPKADGNTHLTASIISDNGTTATIHGNISGSLLQVNTGIEASGLTGVIDTSSRVIFRDGSNRLGALATTDSAVEVSTVLGYKADGTLVATSVIDGGTF